MKAVVMAGGEGSRLRPITANRPKPLVPVCNRPIMGHIIELLKQHEITDIVATLHFLADEITSYFDDGEEFGVNIEYSVEDTPLGTAGSVKKAEHLLMDGTFVIISGDAMTDCDLTKAIEFHRAKGSLATLVLYRVPNPLEFGVVITDPEDKIVRFLEKPSWSEVFSDTVNTGIYILEPEIFELMESGKNYDWSQEIFPELLRRGKPIYGYVMEGYWCDVGTLMQYREAQEDLLSGKTCLNVSGKAENHGIWINEGSTVDPSVELVPPCIIGRNVKIKAGARVGPYTAIGDNCIIEEGAVVERSVLWDSVYIGPNAGIHSAILCSRVTVKRDSVVREDAVVGDRCLIDVGCTIRPRIKLWPDKVIERGTTVTMSLVWGNKWRGSLFRELGVAGLSNLEITPDFATRLGSAYGSVLPNGCTVVTGRDSSRSSRMIKRAMMASLLSVGCEVLDMRSMSAPVMRHFVHSSGAAGAIYVRKLPGNHRVTLIEFFDSNGNYLSKALERKVESAFFREDFIRIDPDDLGHIEFASRALEEYQSDLARLLKPEPVRRRLNMLCDFGYSAIGSILPAMIPRYGADAITANSHNDARLAPRTPEDIQRHLQSIQQIVGTLNYDMGVLFLDEGERLVIVDHLGAVVPGSRLFAAVGYLMCVTRTNPKIAMSITGSQIVEDFLTSHGATVIRSKAGTRSILSAAHSNHVDCGGNDGGGFVFPEFHAGFDAMYTLLSIVTMLHKAERTLGEVLAEIPEVHQEHELVRCPWEMKGAVMRQLAESHSEDRSIELTDGIKFTEGDRWALILPDSTEPSFHIYAEAESADEARAMVDRYAGMIRELQAEK